MSSYVRKSFRLSKYDARNHWEGKLPTKGDRRKSTPHKYDFLALRDPPIRNADDLKAFADDFMSTKYEGKAGVFDCLTSTGKLIRYDCTRNIIGVARPREGRILSFFRPGIGRKNEPREKINWPDALQHELEGLNYFRRAVSAEEELFASSRK